MTAHVLALQSRGFRSQPHNELCKEPGRILASSVHRDRMRKFRVTIAKLAMPANMSDRSAELKEERIQLATVRSDECAFHAAPLEEWAAGERVEMKNAVQ